MHAEEGYAAGGVKEGASARGDHRESQLRVPQHLGQRGVAVIRPGGQKISRVRGPERTRRTDGGRQQREVRGWVILLQGSGERRRERGAESEQGGTRDRLAWGLGTRLRDGLGVRRGPGETRGCLPRALGRVPGPLAGPVAQVEGTHPHLPGPTEAAPAPPSLGGPAACSNSSGTDAIQSPPSRARPLGRASELALHHAWAPSSEPPGRSKV